MVERGREEYNIYIYIYIERERKKKGRKKEKEVSRESRNVKTTQR